MHLMTLQLCCNFPSINALAAAKVPFLKGKLPSMKCFAVLHTSQIISEEKDWLEIIRETCFYKVDGVTYYGHSLKGTNGL